MPPAAASPPTPEDITALRRAVRRLRRALPAVERQAAGRRAAALLARCLRLRSGQRVALYLSIAEEFPTAELLRLAWRRGCKVYLPVIAHGRLRLLRFAPVTAPRPTPQGRRPAPLSGLRRNHLGIDEPTAPRHAWRRARELDVVVMPLVAFDDAGHRLGMGGGYYDRALARTSGRRPWRLGTALDCQQLPHVPRRVWDEPLDAILTGTRLQHFNQGNRR